MDEATEYKKYLEALRKARESVQADKENKKKNQKYKNFLVVVWVSLLEVEILKE